MSQLSNKELIIIREALEFHRQYEQTTLATSSEVLPVLERIEGMIRPNCDTCGNRGFLGSPPDDFYDCPDCVGAITKEADASFEKIQYATLTQFACDRFKSTLANWLAHGYTFKNVSGVNLSKGTRIIHIDEHGLDTEAAKEIVKPTALYKVGDSIHYAGERRKVIEVLYWQNENRNVYRLEGIAPYVKDCDICWQGAPRHV
jgi:hypothetical protein